MMSRDNLQETASAGSTGAASIAVNHSAGHDRGHDPVRSDRHGDHAWRSSVAKDKEDRAKSDHIQSQLARAKEIKANREKEKKKEKRGSFANFFRRKVNEEFDMGSIVSQLKGMENSSSDSVSAAVSYGIEDDKGNFMRITVKSDQAKEFEMAIARRMADNKDNTTMGLNSQKQSLPEIVFDLQNEFDILDLEFPNIPKDAVYNQGEATVGQPNQPADNQSFNQPGVDDQMGGDALGADTNGDLGGDLGSDNSGGEFGDDLSGASDLGAPVDNSDLGLPPDETDADNVENFGDESVSDSDPSSLLKSLVDMLKKQAEAETAKANAAAEQARATQAEWSAISANKEVERQEELARVQADLDQKKDREKQAKQYADIARFRVQQGKGALNNMGEGIEDESFLYASLLEDATQITNIAALQQQKQEITKKYAAEPNDSALDKNFKAAAMRLEMGQINNRIDFLKLTDQYNKQKEQQNQNNNQQNQQNQNQNDNTNNQQNQNNNQPQSQATNQGVNPNANQGGVAGGAGGSVGI
jgi:hypothetical protein